MSNLNLFNQPCLSNPEMREYAVKYICDFFTEHPNYEYFSLAAEDEPCYWCECDNCRALDSDHGKGEWVRKGEAGSTVKVTDGVPMADRSLDFINYVARRVEERFPGKKLTTYCYGSMRVAPVEKKMADNVVMIYCYYLTDPPDLFPVDTTDKQLSTWQKQGGVKKFGVYDYDNYLHPDTIWSGLRYSFMSLLQLHDRYNAVIYEPESHQSVWSNPLLYRLRADALWGTSETFEALVKRYCHQYYGKGGDAMEKYILAMDDAFLTGRCNMAERSIKSKDIIYCPELTLEDLGKTRPMLLEARKLVEGDKQMEKRVDWVIFAHDLTVLAVIDNMEQPDYRVQQDGPAAYNEARSLAEKYYLDFSMDACNVLKEFYMPPIVKATVQKLPKIWRFRPDKGKVGEGQKWYAAAHPDWKKISVEQAWTEQGYGDHHGDAWYEIEFDFKGNESPRLALYCGAIDGKAWFYLDGEKIGEQIQAPDKMWDKPFTIPLKELASGPHRLTIKVSKDSFAAGIWKPISIVILE